MRSVCDRGGAGRDGSGAGQLGRRAERTTEYDLRRRGDLARAAEVLLARADLLREDEAALIRSVFGRGMTLSELARAAGRRPHTIGARVRRIAARMDTPAFAFVAGHRETWPRPMRAVATACILEGRTVREAAAHLKMSVAAVRRHRDAVLALGGVGCRVAAADAPTASDPGPAREEEAA